MDIAWLELGKEMGNWGLGSVVFIIMGLFYSLHRLFPFVFFNLNKPFYDARSYHRTGV